MKKQKYYKIYPNGRIFKFEGRYDKSTIYEFVIPNNEETTNLIEILKTFTKGNKDTTKIIWEKFGKVLHELHLGKKSILEHYSGPRIPKG